MWNANNLHSGHIKLFSFLPSLSLWRFFPLPFFPRGEAAPLRFPPFLSSNNRPKLIKGAFRSTIDQYPEIEFRKNELHPALINFFDRIFVLFIFPIVGHKYTCTRFFLLASFSFFFTFFRIFLERFVQRKREIAFSKHFSPVHNERLQPLAVFSIHKRSVINDFTWFILAVLHFFQEKKTEKRTLRSDLSEIQHDSEWKCSILRRKLWKWAQFAWVLCSS